MPSDVAGVGLQAHHYSDDKWIPLISICFLPLPPRLFLLLLTCTSNWLSHYAQGEKAAKTFSSFVIFFTLSICLGYSFLRCSFYAPDIPSLLCPFLVVFHLPCGFLRDNPTEGLKGLTDTVMMNILTMTRKQSISQLIAYLFKIQVRQKHRAEVLAG